MLDDIFRKLFSSAPAPAGPVEYIVAGLGNPGYGYEYTRHNAGYLAMDFIAARHKTKITRVKFKSYCGDCTLAGKRALLLKPATYMNRSGQAVQEAMAFHKIPIENVLVICDDISLPFGVTRIRRKGSDGGHNGLKNIIYLTGQDTFPRIKIGVGGKPHADMELADWVLGQITPEEEKALGPVWESTLAAVELILKGSIEEAMNRFN